MAPRLAATRHLSGGHGLSTGDRHDLLIIGDEIHGDIVYPGSHHIPIASLPGAAERTITLTSASKSFNLAGLRYSVSHCTVPWLKERLSVLPDHIYGATNIMGAEAARATELCDVVGDSWSDRQGDGGRCRPLKPHMIAE